MLEKLNLLTENRQISPSPMTAQGNFPITQDPPTPQALSKSQQNTPSMNIDNDLKRKAPTIPVSPPNTQIPEDESFLEDQEANAARTSRNPSKIREKGDNGNNPPPATSGGGMT